MQFLAWKTLLQPRLQKEKEKDKQAKADACNHLYLLFSPANPSPALLDIAWQLLT
jgi:hypothetical protein